MWLRTTSSPYVHICGPPVSAHSLCCAVVGNNFLYVANSCDGGITEAITLTIQQQQQNNVNVIYCR